MSKMSTLSVIGAVSIALLLAGCGNDEKDDSPAESTSPTTSSASATSDATASSMSVDGNPIEGSFFPVCQHGASGFTLVGIVDIADENNSALASFTDDGGVLSVGIGKAASGETLWEAWPEVGKGTATLTRTGDLTFTFIGEAVNKETQEEAPFEVTVVCDRIEEK